MIMFVFELPCYVDELVEKPRRRATRTGLRVVGRDQSRGWRRVRRIDTCSHYGGHTDTPSALFTYKWISPVTNT